MLRLHHPLQFPGPETIRKRFCWRKNRPSPVPKAILPVFQIVKTGRLETLKDFQPAAGDDGNAKGLLFSRALPWGFDSLKPPASAFLQMSARL